eukprot:4578617-Pleurochrysis_carterae.AAC.1
MYLCVCLRASLSAYKRLGCRHGVPLLHGRLGRAERSESRVFAHYASDTTLTLVIQVPDPGETCLQRMSVEYREVDVEGSARSTGADKVARPSTDCDDDPESDRDGDCEVGKKGCGELQASEISPKSLFQRQQKGEPFTWVLSGLKPDKSYTVAVRAWGSQDCWRSKSAQPDPVTFRTLAAARPASINAMAPVAGVTRLSTDGTAVLPLPKQKHALKTCSNETAKSSPASELPNPAPQDAMPLATPSNTKAKAKPKSKEGPNAKQNSEAPNGTSKEARVAPPPASQPP